jgi:hypothetical protein
LEKKEISGYGEGNNFFGSGNTGRVSDRGTRHCRQAGSIVTSFPEPAILGKEREALG